jgi:predicted GH43/DUF377 family glycosyl hydrolase
MAHVQSQRQSRAGAPTKTSRVGRLQRFHSHGIVDPDTDRSLFMHSIAVTKPAARLAADARRVLANPYFPGEKTHAGTPRAKELVDRVLALSEDETSRLFGDTVARFSRRHRHFEKILDGHFELVRHLIEQPERLTLERRLLVGAHFTREYSVEAAALFNPSIVFAPDQSGVAAGAARFIMAVRAVGEGHLSSIGFRTGSLDASGTPSFDAHGPYVVQGKRTAPRAYDKYLFREKLRELGGSNEIADAVLSRVPDAFGLPELERSLGELEADGPPAAISFETMKIMRVLASSNYVTTFPADSTLAERVIFPAGPNETRGMEDARFVRFVGEDGVVKYYATYTAYDGFEIVPQLIETDDFRTFTIATLNGAAAQNKGMALFPRLIGGKYVMLSRHDGISLQLAVSDNVRFWNDVTPLDWPESPWELVHGGNCGSPLETEKGWLVLTHGVGAVRRYAIGALLLDRDDPRRVIGRLREPLLEPEENEREGYVPNVLYTCGAVIHAGRLVMPYGYADSGIRIALVSLDDLLRELCKG